MRGCTVLNAEERQQRGFEHETAATLGACTIYPKRTAWNLQHPFQSCRQTILDQAWAQQQREE